MIQCTAGITSSFAITDKGKLYAWGENKNMVMGEIETSEAKRNVIDIIYEPLELPINKDFVKCAGSNLKLFEQYFKSSENTRLSYTISKKLRISKIACGGTHSLAITNTGDILSWGYGNYVISLN